MMMRVALLLMIVFSFSACKKDDKILEENIAEIKKYVADNNLADGGLKLEEDESGLFYIITREGDGTHPTVNNEVEVNYKGYLTNKSVFDQNQNLSFPLANVIKGWQIGIPKISRGGSAYLLIPSKLGYGSSGQGDIPGDAVLIFEVDLISFQ